MKLTNAYIIDGDVIEKMILDAKKERDDFFSIKMFEAAQRQQGMIDCLEVLLNENLKPALPIVEEYIKPTIDYTLRYGSQNSVEWIVNEVKQDFLTKDF
jgi:hypothetical protein